MKILKTIKYILPVIGLLIGTASCSDEYNESLTATTDPHYLNVDKTSMSFSSSKGTQSLGVTSVGVAWTLSNNTSWVSLDKNNGSSSETVNVSVEENDLYSASGRAATLQLSGTGANTRNITVNQESPSLALTVSPASVELKAAEGSSATISVVCNNKWSVSVADNSWLTATKSDGGVTVTVKENTTGSARSTTISISSASKIENVRITQKAANTTVSSETLTFGHAASKKTLSIKSDASWTVKNNYSWIDVTPKDGSAGTTDISVAVTKNTSNEERIGSFSIGTKEVKVTQEGVNLSVIPSTLSFAEAGEKLPLTIKSNTTWKVSSKNSDISFSKTNGEGDATIKVTMPRNTGTVKQFLVTVEATDGSNRKEMITISQDGSGMTDITSLSTFAKEGGKIDYSVPALSNWTAEVPSEYSSWIHITPTSGNKDATITITVDKTTDINDRSGYFILTYDFGAKYRVMINQYGAGIVTSVSSCQFFAKGGTSEAITVQSLGDVTSSTSVDWLTAKLNGNLLTITAAENLTGKIRTGTVTLQLKGKAQTVAITVTQASQHGDLSVDGYGSDVNLIGNFVSSITISPTNSTMYVGDTKTLTATISPTNADNKNVIWSSSNTSVATVSSSGVVTAKAVGTATITATAADDGGAMATCSVSVKERDINIGGEDYDGDKNWD